MQKGGVILKDAYDEKSAREYFVKNSKIYILSYTSLGGILFRLVLNDGVESPYVMARSNSPYIDVKTLAVKCVLISSHKSIVRIEFGDEYARLQTSTDDEFYREVDTQIDIFQKSLDKYLEPICPSIVDISTENEVLNSLVGDSNFRIAGDRITQALLDQIWLEDVRKGFIFMECLEGFDPLLKAIDNADGDKIKKLRAMAIYELARLYEIGYVHGDPHQANILFNPNYKYVDNGEFMGRAIVIDFGKTRKININMPNPTFSLNSVLFNNLLIIDRNWHSYRWLAELYVPAKVAEYISILNIIVNRREQSKKEFMEHMKEERKRQRENINMAQNDDRVEKLGGRDHPGKQQQLIDTWINENSTEPKITDKKRSSSPFKMIPENSIVVKPFETDQEYAHINYLEMDPTQLFTEKYIHDQIKKEMDQTKRIKSMADNLKKHTQTAGKKSKRTMHKKSTRSKWSGRRTTASKSRSTKKNI